MTQIRGQPELQRDTLTHKTKAKTNKQKHSAEDGVLAQDAQGLGSSPSTEKKKKNTSEIVLKCWGLQNLWG